MSRLRLADLPARGGATEVVECKGAGHPDTLCDAIAEELSIALSKLYLDCCGRILHHNVDKVLLRGGASSPAFGAGHLDAPIEVYVAGRATRRVGTWDLPVGELVDRTVRRVLRHRIRNLDVERGVVVHDLVRSGSGDLVGLFDRGSAAVVPLANDSSVGVGSAPLSRLERAVHAADRALRLRARSAPSCGEDTKVLGVARGDHMELTCACAMVGQHLPSLAAYVAAVEEVRAEIARATGIDTPRIHVNTADDLGGGQCFLTVTGTSAEAGDDGEVGRGNRVGGLITPARPMTLEAAAGKNPVAHVGKLYNVAAHVLAGRLVEAVEGLEAAEVLLVSQIGRPIDDPHVVEARLRLAPGLQCEDVACRVEALVDEELVALPSMWRRLLVGAIRLY
jgi:S-adenosylmethionine synthetase